MLLETDQYEYIGFVSNTNSKPIIKEYNDRSFLFHKYKVKIGRRTQILQKRKLTFKRPEKENKPLYSDNDYITRNRKTYNEVAGINLC